MRIVNLPVNNMLENFLLEWWSLANAGLVHSELDVAQNGGNDASDELKVRSLGLALINVCINNRLSGCGWGSCAQVIFDNIQWTTLAWTLIKEYYKQTKQWRKYLQSQV